MAVGNLSSIAAHLLDNGRPPAISVTCIQHAATPQHRVMRCTLADLAASEADLQVENPAVIIMGPTVPVLPASDGDKTRPLAMPVLAIGGAASWGEAVGNAMKLAADDVQSVVIPGAGHWVAEQAPEEMLAALTAFLAPYRDRG